MKLNPFKVLFDTPDSLILKVPAPEKYMNANDRPPHWAVKAKQTKAWREAGYAAALTASLPKIDKAHIVATLFFHDSRQRDPNNYNPTTKAILDGMVDAGVFVDDNWKHVVGPDHRVGETTVKRGQQLYVVLNINPIT